MHYTVSYYQVTLPFFLYFLASFFSSFITPIFPISFLRFYFFVFIYILFGHWIFSEATRIICKPVMWLKIPWFVRNLTWLIMIWSWLVMLCKTYSCINNLLTNKDDSTHLRTWFVSTFLPIHMMTHATFYSCFVRLHFISYLCSN
jgi:hypothetical protein